MLPAILAGSSSSVLSAVAPSLLMLLKNMPGQQYAAFQQQPRRRVSHLANNEGGHAASGSTGAFGPNKTSDSPSLQQAKRPFIPRGTAASHLRSFAAQPALAEDNQMFCVSCLRCGHTDKAASCFITRTRQKWLLWLSLEQHDLKTNMSQLLS
jgi:hypothetical protein